VVVHERKISHLPRYESLFSDIQTSV